VPPAAADPAEDDAPIAPGPGEATLVYDKNKGRARGAADPVKLVAVAGPRKGSEFALTDDVTTIGRGSDNVLVIPDISVSRQHVIVQREGERWVVLDQGSGNGTKVNGKPVERYPLQHGDEIAMGDTVLQVVEPGGVVVRGAKRAPTLADAGEPASPRAARESPFRKRVPLYLAILGALLIALGAGVVRKQKRARDESASAQQGEESRALAQQRFQEGVTLLKQGRWVDARAKLKLAAELDSTDPEIARYLESAAAEAPRAQGLAAAKAALGRKDFAAAHAALAGIPDDSALAEGARDLEQQLAAALDAAVREAKARAEEGDAAGAAELLEPVLAADPQRADALAVRAAIGSPRPQRAAAAPAQRRERPAHPEGSERIAGEAPAPPPEVQPILDAYLSGDLGAALERAEAAQSNPRALRLLGQLKTFDAAYKEGLARSQAKKTNEALRSLESAASADRAIAQGKDSPSATRSARRSRSCTTRSASRRWPPTRACRRPRRTCAPRCPPIPRTTSPSSSSRRSSRAPRSCTCAATSPRTATPTPRATPSRSSPRPFPRARRRRRKRSAGSTSSTARAPGKTADGTRAASAPGRPPAAATHRGCWR
jgi:pSer/pThr/pTyr-binding forkhead associated (FHA) protein